MPGANTNPRSLQQIERTKNKSRRKYCALQDTINMKGRKAIESGRELQEHTRKSREIVDRESGLSQSSTAEISAFILTFVYLPAAFLIDYVLFSPVADFLVRTSFYDLGSGFVHLAKAFISACIITANVALAIRIAQARESGQTGKLVTYSLAALSLVTGLVMLAYITTFAAVEISGIEHGHLIPIGLGAIAFAVHAATLLSGNRLLQSFGWAVFLTLCIQFRLAIRKSRRKFTRSWIKTSACYRELDRLRVEFNRIHRANLPAAQIETDVLNLINQMFEAGDQEPVPRVPRPAAGPTPQIQTEPRESRMSETNPQPFPHPEVEWDLHRAEAEVTP